MAEVGHNDPKMTLGVYARVMTVDEDFGPVLEGLVGRAYRTQADPPTGQKASPSGLSAPL